MDGPSITWRPLGRLLVAQGLLTHAELVTAIENQERTGRRLGEILVERGYVTASTLASSLAEQFGIGLAATDPPVRDPREVRRPGLRIVPVGEEPNAAEALPEPRSAFEYQRLRLAEAQLALGARDQRIAELEAALALATGR